MGLNSSRRLLRLPAHDIECLRGTWAIIRLFEGKRLHRTVGRDRVCSLYHAGLGKLVAASVKLDDLAIVAGHGGCRLVIDQRLV